MRDDGVGPVTAAPGGSERADRSTSGLGAGAPPNDLPPPDETARPGGRARGRRGRNTAGTGGGGTGGGSTGGGLRSAARRHPVRAALSIAALVILAVLAGLVVWYEGEADPGPAGAATVVSVRSGQSMGSVTETLSRQQVLSSGLAFRIYLLLHGTPVVQAGYYLLHRNDSFADIRSRLASGPDVFTVDVLPGFTVGEVAERVGEIPGHDGPTFAALATSGAMRSPYQPAGSTNLDGLLGTGSYLVLPGESDRTLLRQMIDRFDTLAGHLELSSGAAALGLTPYQEITVASIVQKEGVYPKNLGKVARVIFNRLARGSPLQMDSTVLYSEHRDGGPVTGADLALDTPYNTYLHTGLTPTPICFPSPASIGAALGPTPGNWLYFVVVSKDGTEAFSDTFAGQQANERVAAGRGLG
jgi:UPF0755 protein